MVDAATKTDEESQWLQDPLNKGKTKIVGNDWQQYSNQQPKAVKSQMAQRQHGKLCRPEEFFAFYIRFSVNINNLNLGTYFLTGFTAVATIVWIFRGMP